MKRLFLLLSAILLLTACVPPKPDIVDVVPPVVPPVEDTIKFSGFWDGVMSFTSPDAFGNVEVQVTRVTSSVLEYSETNGEFSGDFTIFTAMPSDCTMSGRQLVSNVNIVVVCSGIERFRLTGGVEDGIVFGKYTLSSTGTVFRAGSFSLSYMGETENE